MNNLNFPPRTGSRPDVKKVAQTFLSVAKLPQAGMPVLLCPASVPSDGLPRTTLISHNADSRCSEDAKSRDKQTTTRLFQILSQKEYVAAILLLLLAAILLAAGAIWGEPGLVWRNAQYLCLDCLGIG